MHASSIGTKAVMAITGLMLVGFLVGHMLGNLQIWLGPEMINSYAEKLHEMFELLVVARTVLIVAVVLHIAAGIRLYALNRAARPSRYAYGDVSQKASLASRSMLLSGIIVFAFIVFHLLHFTFRVVPGTEYPTEYHKVYSMMVSGFSNVLVSGSYVLAQALLAMHVAHAVPSMLQTLGLLRPSWERFNQLLGPVFAGVLFLGYVSIPAGVLSGLIPPLEEGETALAALLPKLFG